MNTAITFTTTLPSFNADTDLQVEHPTAEDKKTLLKNAMQNFRNTRAFPLVRVEIRNQSGEINSCAAWFIGYNDNNTFAEDEHRISAHFLMQVDGVFFLASSQTWMLDAFRWARFESNTHVVSNDLLGCTLDDTYVIVPTEEIDPDVREALMLVSKI